jgi:hypothetical protein
LLIHPPPETGDRELRYRGRTVFAAVDLELMSL